MARKPTVGFDAKAFLTKASTGRSVAAYRKKQVIFAQGDPADAVFYLEKGQITLTVVSGRGKSAIVAMLGRGDFFGEGCLAGQPVRMATASAMTEASVVRVERQAMVGLLHESSILCERFTAHLLARNVRFEEDLVDQLFNSSEKRLARVLLLLARFGKEGATDPVIPKVSQEVLAEMVGTTRPRISVFMNKFRKLGFIEYNGGLHISARVSQQRHRTSSRACEAPAHEVLPLIPELHGGEILTFRRSACQVHGAPWFRLSRTVESGKPAVLTVGARTTALAICLK
jgi:CRP-like cAMP-binding protein